MIEDFQIEQQESLPDTVVMTREELRDLIYQGSGVPQDVRFLEPEKGGVFKYFNIQNLINPHKKDEDLVYPSVKVDNKIIAISELEKSPYEENVYWITGVSVDPEFQGKRYATLVLEEIFKFAKEHTIALEASKYSEEGLIKLKPVCSRLSHEYGVDFRDPESEY